MTDVTEFKKKTSLAIAIEHAQTDIEILEYMIRVKQFNIDNAEVMTKKVVRECQQDITKYEDELSGRKEQLALYQEEWNKQQE